ncbi:kinesin light chain 1 and [Cordyceps javanica]|uniref:Kinesin light chain 1 and n=1 Tax=Cordyceps javanica TaxID=43265 RepID=A0A545VTP0_9HYPO|nr:kinesin light chain 1 and [Cordyceps javanica]TQW05079.1 kinesin light chain 1 and [Cordyceps javanica]
MVDLDPTKYAIAWIAPLEIEARAAACMLDRKHVGRFPMQRGDDYVYMAGEMCGHNVVIATLPAGQEYGNGAAAALASQIKKFFPNFWFGLLVGVAAGLPRLTGRSPRDIRLGDVLVALPEGDSAGLIAYDLGKETGSDGFQLLRGGHVLAVTETVVRAAIGSIKAQAPDDTDLILPYYNEIQNKQHSSGTFADPGQDTDRFYGDDESGRPTIRAREPRPDDQRTRIWYGPIGSGDKLIKNALKRNELRDRYNMIGLEMEAAGTMNRIPVGVIRGVCDYGDEHKNKEWQPYAAAMAAAYVHYIPFARNHRFTGRRKELDQLERILFRENRERVAVVGLGGMGKTQTALELAYRVRNMEVEDVKERHSVFWVQAQSMAAFHKTAGELVQQLKIPCDDDDPKEAFREYLASDAAGYWLLVVDNIDDVVVLDGAPNQSPGLSEFFPRSRKGRILLTTRQTSVAVDVASSDVVELSSMKFDEAYLLMETLLVDKSRVQDAESTKELLEKLTCFPLALAQAAAYMNKNRLPIIRYLKLCQSVDQNMVNLFTKQLRDETHHSGMQGAVATTWIVSFEAVRKTDANAVRLLSFIRWIESKAIPVNMLPPAGSQMELDESIGLLCGYGFLSWREDNETLDMHSLVHLGLRLWLDQAADDSLTTEDAAIEHLYSIFPSHEWENRLVWRLFLPHVLPLVKDIRLQADKTVQSLGHTAGLCLRVDGRTIEAVEVLELIATIRKETLAETHPSRLASQHALAIAYQANGQVKEAIQVLEHVVAIRKETLAKTHPSRLASQHMLAGAYQANGQVKEAIQVLEHVVAIRKETLAKTHPDRLAAQHTLAMAYQANGQVKEAIQVLEYVVAIYKETLAKTHPSRLAAQHALAIAYEANGQVKEAIQVIEHVVAIQKETLAKTHPSRLASQHVLAIAYRANGQVKEAIQVLEHVVAIEKETLAKTHPSRLASQHELAIAYQANGQVKEAIQVLEHVVAIREETLAETHPDRLASQHALAIVYQANGQVKETEGIQENRDAKTSLYKHRFRRWKNKS